ncbi:winged helix-turn-helix transcriptional regulator [Halomicrobium katesii]|uniref:winged helix-turn-helix transcriptional regulator n=1 Tax=Halomicrobium katesii TaxID=437163 RepID=UPI000382C986|nr:winged helix-turn-helix transcriptional regulator [Halomicrobium katesii]
MDADGTTDTVVADPDGSKPSQPRALIHKKILDTAQSNPTAATAEIATAVSGASVELVEQVLQEYGDPAAEDDQPVESDDQDTVDDETPEPEDGEAEPRISAETGSGEKGEGVDLAALDEKQRETLRAIHRQPAATQAEIADTLDVSRATIPKRVNDIPGFDWPSRQAFVEALFETDAESDDDLAAFEESLTESLEELTARIETIETELQTTTPTANAVHVEPGLLYKVVHACMDADYISRDEELQLLRRLLPDAADD